VLNVEIMKALDTAMRGRRVRFEWVKGHSGHPLNEAADRLANAAAVAFSQGRPADPGPGFGGPIRGAAPAGRPASAEPDDLFTILDDRDRPAPPTDEERVIHLERSLLTDQVRADPAAVAALLHPQWCEIGRSGRLWTREEMLESIGPLADPVDLEVVMVSRVDSDTLLLVWRAVAAGHSALRSSLWVGEGGDWRQRFHQGTTER
jgi:ribonuclease HI